MAFRRQPHHRDLSGPARPAAALGQGPQRVGVVAAGEHHQIRCATHRRTFRPRKVVPQQDVGLRVCCRPAISTSATVPSSVPDRARLLGHPGPESCWTGTSHAKRHRERDQLPGRRRSAPPAARPPIRPWVTVSAPSASSTTSATAPGHRPTGRPTSGPPEPAVARDVLLARRPQIAAVVVGPGLSWNTYSA